ncbi:MAG: glycoside hydrolase family 99-like domain-containing protein [Chloroflexi bacterium]|nr:glycoside hydrolase family 99-like domain-containing protein [Chloroflexota bacterium]
MRRLYERLIQLFWRLPIPEGVKRRLAAIRHRLFPPVPPVSKRPSPVVLDKYVRQVLSTPELSPEFVDLAPDTYERQPGDPMLLAYYLPQFHPTPENDEWWGKGVTEWHNVSRAVPQYVGHYQPRLPAELGQYDLRIVENIARQAELAKIHGVYGFAYYFYWFDGRRLLDKPLDLFLNNPQIDYPFCLCWANESWTRRFDGTSGEVIMYQNESVESYKAFIESVKPYMQDRRYIRVDGRPLLIVYRPSFVPNPPEVLAHWREVCQRDGLGNPYIIAVKENTFDGDLLALGFDAQSEFHPGTVFRYCNNITAQLPFVREDFRGLVLDYEDLVKNKKYFKFQARKLHRAVMPMWDNTPRRNNTAMIYHGASPALYKEWLADVLRETRSNSELDSPFVFLNAWNEWGESAYLEPDRRYGYAFLRATREAIEETRTPNSGE